MALLIITVILFIAAFVALGLKDKDGDLSWGFQIRQVLSLIVFILLIFGTFTKVPANNVGILYSPFNGTSNQTLPEGFHSKNIFDKVYDISTEVQTTSVENLTTQTKDAQYVSSTLDIKYRVSETNAYLVFKQFRTLDNMSKTLIVPTTQRVLELTTTKYNVMDVLGEARADVYKELEAAMTNELLKYGVEFYSISITDMDAGDEIEAAITKEAVAKKSVETAEQELLKAETDAKKKSVDAKANQDAAKIEAETKVIEANAEKEANDLLQQSLTPELLEKMWIEKWDGQLPKVSSENVKPIFDVTEEVVSGE